jgi:hypothetical protein
VTGWFGYEHFFNFPRRRAKLNIVLENAESLSPALSPSDGPREKKVGS